MGRNEDVVGKGAWLVYWYSERVSTILTRDILSERMKPSLMSKGKKLGSRITDQSVRPSLVRSQALEKVFDLPLQQIEWQSKIS